MFPAGQPAEMAAAAASAGDSSAEREKPSAATMVHLEGWQSDEVDAAKLNNHQIDVLTLETTEGDIAAGESSLQHVV